MELSPPLFCLLLLLFPAFVFASAYANAGRAARERHSWTRGARAYEPRKWAIYRARAKLYAIGGGLWVTGTSLSLLEGPYPALAMVGVWVLAGGAYGHGSALGAPSPEALAAEPAPDPRAMARRTTWYALGVGVVMAVVLALGPFPPIAWLSLASPPLLAALAWSWSRRDPPIAPFDQVLELVALFGLAGAAALVVLGFAGPIPRPIAFAIAAVSLAEGLAASAWRRARARRGSTGAKAG